MVVCSRNNVTRVGALLFALFSLWSLACRGPDHATVEAARLELRSPDAQTHLQAIARLAKLGPKAESAIPDLMALYDRGGYEARDAIITMLPAVDPKGQKIVPFLKRALGDRFVNIRARSVAALRKIDARAEIPLFIKLLGDESYAVRGEAAHALALMAPEARSAVPHLQRARVTEKDGRVRAFMTLALVKLEPENGGNLNAFRALFADREPEARQFALVFLRHTPIESDERLERLRTALDDPDVKTRRMAVRMAGQLGEEATPLISHLFAAFYHPEMAMSREAIRALGRVDPQGGKLVPHLVRSLRHTSSRVRSDAVVGLGQIADPSTLPHVIAAVADPVKQVKLEAMRAIGRLGPAASAGIPTLLAQMESGEPEVAYVAAETVASFGAASVAPLRGKLADRRAALREKALFALGLIGPPAAAALPDIAPLKQDPDPTVRAAALQAIRRIGAP